MNLIINLKNKQIMSDYLNTDANDENFWDELETNKILKWNPSGKYDKKLTPEYNQMLEKFNNLTEAKEIKLGDIVTGQISKINDQEIIIDVNYKDSIYVDIKAPDFKIVKNLNLGDNLDVMVTQVSEKPYEIKGSITELIKIDVANKLREHYLDKTPLIAHVLELIPAGFMLDIEMNNINITAFMPNTLAGVNRLTTEQSQAIIGTDIQVMLESLQQEKGVYVVSRKKYLNSLIPIAIEQLKKTRLENPETVYSGYVTGTKDFGVFVEFNECLTGMIHKVNIDLEWQDRLMEIKPGTPIEFYVRDVLRGDKVILSQMLRESLWDSIRVNQIREGKVRAIKPFGALIALDDETTGLIQNTYIDKSGKTLKIGDTVNVKIVSVIKDDRKIYLDFAKGE